MTQIVKDTVSNQVHRHLRSKIVQGEYEEGARLVEEDIASELGVSRTPVREALWQLRSFDLVRPLGKSGYEVVNVQRELSEILDIRAALEAHAVRKAAAVIADDELDRLDGLCARMEKADFSDSASRAKLNRSFHDALISAAGNARLSRLVAEYHEYFDLAQPIFDKKDLRDTQRQHREIVQALREHNPDRAAERVTRHIRDAAKLLDRVLESRRKSESKSKS
jgi:DNA-binding GntR family transcriptional regulator